MVQVSYVVPGISNTVQGVTVMAGTEPDTIIMYGTCSGTRRWCFLNDQNSIKTSSSAFDKILDAGDYYIESSISGFQSIYSVAATYSTFSNAFAIVGTAYGWCNKYTFTAPVMIGMTLQNGRDYGTEDNPTILKLKIYKMSAKDIYARSKVDKNESGINNLNKKLIAFGDFGTTGSSLVVTQEYDRVILNGESNATASQASTKILLSGPLTVRNGSEQLYKEQTYPITLLDGHKYRLGVNAISGERSDGGGSGNITIRLYAENYVNIITGTMGMDDNFATVEVVGKGQKVNVYIYVARLMTFTDFVMSFYLEDITTDFDLDQIKDYIGTSTGNRPIEFVHDKFITVTGSTPLDIYSNINDSTQGCGYAIVDVEEGDVFTLNSYGGSSRAYAVFDADGYRLLMATSGALSNNTIITIPKGGAKLVINARPQDGPSFYGEIISKKHNDVATDFDRLELGAFRNPIIIPYVQNENNWTLGSGVNKDTGTHFSDTAYCRTGYAPLEKPMVITFESTDYEFGVWEYSTNSVYYAIYTPSHNKYSSTGPYLLTPDHGALYFRIGVHKIDGTQIEASELQTIINSIKIYTLVDNTLTQGGIPAEAYIVGQHLINISNTLTNKADIQEVDEIDERLSDAEYDLKYKADLEKTKNLWIFGDYVVDSSGVTITENIEEFTKSVSSSSTIYCLSADIESDSEGTIGITFYGPDSGTPPIVIVNTIWYGSLEIGGRKSVTAIISGLDKLTRIRITKTTTDPAASVTISNIQFEKGSSATEYIPPYVQNDFVARKNIEALDERVDSLEDYVDSIIEDELPKKAGAIENSASGSHITIHDAADGVNFKEISVSFEEPLQRGEGDPSPENIRPIDSFKTLELNVTGKNIFDAQNATIVEREYIKDDGTVATISQYNCCESYIHVLPNTLYTVSYTTTGTGAGFTVPFYDKDKNFISRAVAVGSDVGIKGFNFGTITTPPETEYLRFSYPRNTESIYTIQIEKGSTYTEYESFGRKIDFSWYTAPYGGVSYGGKLLIYPNGKYNIVDTKNMFLFYGESSIAECGVASTGARYIKSINIPDLISSDMTLVSNQYSNVSFSAPNPGVPTIRAANSCIFVYDDRFTDIETAANIVSENNIQIVYSLSEPRIRNSRDVPDGPISSVLGENNIWAYLNPNNLVYSPVHGEIDIKYYSDTNLYINRSFAKVPEPVSSNDGDYILRLTNGQSEFVRIQSASGVGF